MDKTEFDLRVFEQQMAQDNIMLETASGYARLSIDPVRESMQRATDKIVGFINGAENN